jgi:hypothetical protein
MVTTGVAGATTFSPESPEFHDPFWQGIADGVGDQNFRRSRLSSPGLACAISPAIVMRCPAPQAVRTLASGQVLTDGRDLLIRAPEAEPRRE